MELRNIEGGNICQTDIRTAGHVTELTLCGKVHCHPKKVTSSSPNIFYNKEREKVSKLWALSLVLMSCLPSPLALYLASTPCHMSGGKSLFSFSQSVQKYQTKVWASSLGQYRLMIHQWASLSTAAQDCFSLAHCKLIFFCVHVSAGFRFSFSFIALCFFSWELSWWASFKSHANYRLVYIFRFLQVLFAMWFHNLLFHLLDVEKDKTCY